MGQLEDAAAALHAAANLLDPAFLHTIKTNNDSSAACLTQVLHNVGDAKGYIANAGGRVSEELLGQVAQIETAATELRQKVMGITSDVEQLQGTMNNVSSTLGTVSVRIVGQ